MATIPLLTSPDDRRNISSLLNPSIDNIDDYSNDGLANPQLHLEPFPQQQQVSQDVGVPPIIHTGAEQSHIFSPQTPDHPTQAIIAQNASEGNSYRLTRASWDGIGPPPEGFEEAVPKGKLENGYTEVGQRSLRRRITRTGSDSSIPNISNAPPSNQTISRAKKLKGKSKVTRAKKTAVSLPPSQLQYPTEPYVPHRSAHSTQPSVGLGNAIVMPIPLGPPQLPAPRMKRLKWKKSKHNENNISGAASQLQSADRASLRLAQREAASSPSHQSPSDSPGPSHAQIGPNGQSFVQEHNVNGKRVLESDGASAVKASGKRKRKSSAVPVNAPPHTLNGYGMPAHMPVPMNIHPGNQGGLPLDPAFFPTAGPSNGDSPYANYQFPPGQEHMFYRDPRQTQHFDQSQSQTGPSQLPPQHYPGMDSGPPGPFKLAPELQFARCMSNRYKPDPFPRCVSCTRRWAGDTCRFQGIRFFLRDSESRVMGVSFVDSQAAESPKMKFPNSWNVPLRDAHIRRLKYTVAHAILPTLRAELVHLSLPEVIRRPRETEVRAVCDTCMTSIFACSWMCRLCGREACEDCARQIRELTHPTRAVTPSGEKKLHSNPFFLSCTKRQEHAMKDFSPVSRFCRDELETIIRDMEEFLQREQNVVEGDPASIHSSWPTQEHQEHVERMQELSGPIMTTTETSSIRTSPTQQQSQLPIDPTLHRNGYEESKPQDQPPPDQPSPVQVFVSQSVPLPPPITARYGDPLDPAQVPSLPYYVFDRAGITEGQFQPLWATSQTLLVTNLLDSFSTHWTPDYFIQNFDQQKCLILECHTDENRSVTVGEFFGQFGEYAGRSKCWKLKDWPPSADFKTAFHELYEDFSHALPMPNYTRRDGVLNIASHFPFNIVSPDIGPKMYNAFASTEIPGGKGSTRLHMDMADTVNIMLYSAKRPDGGEGMAAWDIFRAEDTQKIRRFLRKHFKGQYANDPIHSQMFYLDILMRRQLYEEFGVSSWRLYQRPGEAVLIPAGCAHQVVNLADCIKVGCDFVSPENVNRCFNLTREFREQNQSQVWKEDMLQLSAMLWFSWLNLTRVEQGLLSHAQDHDDVESQQPDFPP